MQQGGEREREGCRCVTERGRGEHDQSSKSILSTAKNPIFPITSSLSACPAQVFLSEGRVVQGRCTFFLLEWICKGKTKTKKTVLHLHSQFSALIIFCSWQSTIKFCLQLIGASQKCLGVNQK